MNESPTNPLALAVAGATQSPKPQQALSLFSDEISFVAGQRMARALCSSPLVPDAYRGEANMPSALIALELAQRLHASPLMVMQNLSVIRGKPSWSSQFIIAALNSCGRFSPLRFTITGTGDEKTCVAWAVELATGEKLEGPPVSIAMAKAEGWYGKDGSKWKTMPDLMLRYRSAAFFGRLYAPDVLAGMSTSEEIVDVQGQVVDTQPPVAITPAPQPEQKQRRPKLAKVVDVVPSTPEPTPEPASEPENPNAALHAEVRDLLVKWATPWTSVQKLAADQSWWPNATTASLEDLPAETLSWIIKNQRGIQTTLTRSV